MPIRVPRKAVARGARRFLEQQRTEHAACLPQQKHTRQPQQQLGFSSDVLPHALYAPAAICLQPRLLRRALYGKAWRGTILFGLLTQQEVATTHATKRIQNLGHLGDGLLDRSVPHYFFYKTSSSRCKRAIADAAAIPRCRLAAHAQTKLAPLLQTSCRPLRCAHSADRRLAVFACSPPLCAL